MFELDFVAFVVVPNYLFFKFLQNNIRTSNCSLETSAEMSREGTRKKGKKAQIKLSNLLKPVAAKNNK